MKPSLVLVIIAALAALAGCTERSSGDPKPTRSSDANPSTDPQFADILPERPRELDLTDVNPCTDLLTDQQLRELDYDLGFARRPKVEDSSIHGGMTCTFASNGGDGGPDRDIHSLVGISTTEGALAWVTDPARAPDARPDVVTIERFSALVLPHPKFADDCLVVVDTADGQYLEVESSKATGGGTSAELYCAEAERVAGMAIQTISASK